jgi:hypothetical protein
LEHFGTVWADFGKAPVEIFAGWTPFQNPTRTTSIEGICSLAKDKKISSHQMYSNDILMY